MLPCERTLQSKLYAWKLGGGGAGTMPVLHIYSAHRVNFSVSSTKSVSQLQSLIVGHFACMLSCALCKKTMNWSGSMLHLPDEEQGALVATATHLPF